jgi:peptide/nickel transport system substrate-binding protein
MDKAKQLVKDSGTAGQKIVVITDDTSVGKDIGTYFGSLLGELGYEATVKVISQDNEFTYIQNSNNKIQIAYTQWYQDYPAASDFLNVLYGCGGFHEGSDNSPNIAELCDKDVDDAIKKALATQVTDPKAAEKLWAEIDRKVTDLAPAAVMFNPKHIDFVSKRVQNFIFSSQFYWLIGKSWVQ